MKDSTDWKRRWETGETGWHQTEVEPFLKQFWRAKKGARVFVPLCGKTLDMKWLIDQGHFVVGVDLSEFACEGFFREHGIAFEKKAVGAFTQFESERCILWVGDFFQLTPAMIGPVAAVYDRAALIALPPELRKKYAAHIKNLIKDEVYKPGFEFLQIVLMRTPQDSDGPPFSVRFEEVESHYRDIFETEKLVQEPTEGRVPPGSILEECVIRFKARRH
jgi:thiopurine S-methyltransferase